VTLCRSKLDSLTFFLQRFTLDMDKPYIVFTADSMELVLRFLEIDYFRMAIPTDRRVVFGKGFLIVMHDQGQKLKRNQCLKMYTTIVTVGALAEYVCSFSESDSSKHLEPYHPYHMLDGTGLEMKLLWDVWSVTVTPLHTSGAIRSVLCISPCIMCSC
jgi:hypothetical protein